MPKNQTAKRKPSHIKTTMHEEVHSHVSTGFDDVRLIHKALPQVGRDDIDLSTEIFGHKLSAPLGEKAAIAHLTTVIDELENVMFLTGSHNVQELRHAPLVITGATYQWLTQRGFDPARYATRTYSHDGSPFSHSG